MQDADAFAAEVWSAFNLEWLSHAVRKRDAEHEERWRVTAAALAASEERVRKLEEALSKPADGNTSDGYHTFNELYDYRRVYNALLFNAWSVMGLFDVHKSKRHSDGEECFGGGWFIVVAELPTGQISNHYKLENWDEFNIPERELPNAYDGHTPAIALERARAALEGK